MSVAEPQNRERAVVSADRVVREDALQASRRPALPRLALAPIWPWGVYLAVIVAAELLIALEQALLGVGLHLALLFVLPTHAALMRRSRRPLLIALVFAPLVRIVGLALPVAGLPILAWYVLASLPLFVAIVPATRILGLTRRDLGLRIGSLPLQLGIGLLGAPIGAAMYVILRPEPMVERLTWTTVLGPLLVFLVSIGFLEELIFRGVLRVAAQRVMAGRGIVYVSAVFAALHLGSLSLPSVAAIFGTGLLFAWLATRTGSIFGVGLAHGLVNLVLYILLPTLAVQQSPFEVASVSVPTMPAQAVSAPPEAAVPRDASSVAAPTAISFAPDVAAPPSAPTMAPVAAVPQLPAVAAPVAARAQATATTVPEQVGAAGPDAQQGSGGTPGATPASSPTAQQPASVPIVATAVAVAETSWRTGRLEATVNYGNGPQGTMRILFDRGSDDGKAATRLHVTSTYVSDDGPRTFDRITIGGQSWERDNEGPWRVAPMQLGAWQQVRTMLPLLGPAESLRERDNGATVLLDWYDPTRDADIALEADRATGALRSMRQTNRGNGSTLTVTYSDWNTDVSIEPPIPE